MLSRASNRRCGQRYAPSTPVSGTVAAVLLCWSFLWVFSPPTAAESARASDGVGVLLNAAQQLTACRPTRVLIDGADVPASTGLTLADIVATVDREPKPLLEELIADPFAFRLSRRAPDGARTSGKWLVGTSTTRSGAFPLYRFDPGARSWVPHHVDGEHRAIFPDGQHPRWWRGGPQVPMPWAPEIHVREDFLTVHYTAQDANRIRRIGYATARTVEGPWTDHGFIDINIRARDLAPEYPGVENPVLGMIDSHITTVTDASGCDRTFLLAKVDGNALRWTERDGTPRTAPTPLVAYEIVQHDDGVIELAGVRKVLMTNQPHHDGLVEAPFVVESDREHYLIYSAGYYGNGNYRTYIARLDLLNGRVADERLLIGTGSPALAARWHGPGHPSLIKVGDGLFELYVHAWRTGTDRSSGDSRRALMLHLAFRDRDMRRAEPQVVEGGR